MYIYRERENYTYAHIYAYMCHIANSLAYHLAYCVTYSPPHNTQFPKSCKSLHLHLVGIERLPHSRKETALSFALSSTSSYPLGQQQDAGSARKTWHPCFSNQNNYSLQRSLLSLHDCGGCTWHTRGHELPGEETSYRVVSAQTGKYTLTAEAGPTFKSQELKLFLMTPWELKLGHPAHAKYRELQWIKNMAREMGVHIVEAYQCMCGLNTCGRASHSWCLPGITRISWRTHSP